jgi:hypothetical protein
VWPHAIRARGNPTSLVASVRGEVHAVARDVPTRTIGCRDRQPIFTSAVYRPHQERAMGLEPTTSSLGSGTNLMAPLRNAPRINAERPACFCTRQDVSAYSSPTVTNGNQAGTVGGALIRRGFSAPSVPLQGLRHARELTLALTEAMECGDEAASFAQQGTRSNGEVRA